MYMRSDMKGRLLTKIEKSDEDSLLIVEKTLYLQGDI